MFGRFGGWSGNDEEMNETCDESEFDYENLHMHDYSFSLFYYLDKLRELRESYFAQSGFSDEWLLFEFDVLRKFNHSDASYEIGITIEFSDLWSGMFSRTKK